MKYKHHIESLTRRIKDYEATPSNIKPSFKQPGSMNRKKVYRATHNKRSGR